MMNKYLEKVALNAAAARTMAKKVGIVPDSSSAWKYALRNLRDGKGNPLQGKSLHEARIRLGDLSNNGYQAISKAHRIQGGVKGYEMSAEIKSGKALDIHRGEKGYVPFGTGNGNHNMHTHPNNEMVLFSKHRSHIKGNPHRLAKPSQGDAEILHLDSGNNKYMERIVSPSSHTVSSNRSRKGQIRTVYFDHTPRKVKNVF